MSFEEKEKQPYMAMVAINRTSHHPATSLFGSSVKSPTTICLEIKEASVTRHLSSDFYFGEKLLMEVEFSPNQFAELITNMNSSGIPATIRYLNGRVDGPEYEAKGEEFKKEINDSVKTTLSTLQKAYADVINSLNDDKPLGKKAKQEVASQIQSLNKLLNDSLPFILNQFSKHMDKVVTESKTSVDAFVQQLIVKTGVEEIAKNRPIMIEEPNE